MNHFISRLFWKVASLAAVVLGLSLSGGCLNITPLAQCLQGSDCNLAKGESCNQGICRAPAVKPPSCQKACTTDTDCGPAPCTNNICLNGLCIRPKWHSVSQKKSKDKAVDILFVVDNSGSMTEEQEKLGRNFTAFIEELTRRDVGNYQIGIISTDMGNPLERGTLLSQTGFPKIISRMKLPAPKVIEAFKANISLGVRGTSFEKPLDAMRAALSPRLLDNPKANQGFLRPGAMLSVFFVADEDDCSHNGRIAESELDSVVCRMPKTEVLRDNQGHIVPDSNGNPVKGHMEELIPTKVYVDFLKSLNRPVFVSGLIGDPLVYKDATKQQLIDPAGGCKADIECYEPSGPSRKCVYENTVTRKCGGCVSVIDQNHPKPDANATPGFRLFEVIKAFGGANAWFPICGYDDGFRDALLRTARQMVDRLEYLVLSPAPLPESEARIKVEIVASGGKATAVPRAAASSQTCIADSMCGNDRVCGADGKCYTNGWVFFPSKSSDPGALPWIRLSGQSKADVTAGSSLKATYLIKP